MATTTKKIAERAQNDPNFKDEQVLVHNACDIARIKELERLRETQYEYIAMLEQRIAELERLRETLRDTIDLQKKRIYKLEGVEFEEDEEDEGCKIVMMEFEEDEEFE